MGKEEEPNLLHSPPRPLSSSQPTTNGEDAPPPPPPLSPPPQSLPSVRFNPSRMIGIIKRKALIKDLATVYHSQCLSYCQLLLELQRKWDEPFVDSSKALEDARKERTRPPKRLKKTHEGR